ncbi:protein FMP52, mitochondrial-like [Acropora millepora]|uniref:protein FMP52, mitochondrial-like n=1 Tax=Acropora millepora TaxID=45264 RepID=UPI0010FC72BA|nr:protein FMP52, mitochondrial-like [Acropora millepora]
MADGGEATPQQNRSSEEPLGMRAVLIGATGAVGECLLGELLCSKNVSKVVSLGRRNAKVPEGYSIDQKAEEDSGRLEQHVVDFETISSETVGAQFKDKDVFFCALGTTRSAAGSAAAFRHIDYDYVVNCAKIAKDAKVAQMAYVSSDRADSSSFFLYLKTKGQVEDALKEMHFPKTSIFRPGVLDRGSQKKRFGEKLASWVMPTISVAKVAKAMLSDAENYTRSRKNEGTQQDTPSAVTYGNADILALLSSN